MSDFLFGLLALPILLTIGLVEWLLYSAATWAWDRLHVALLYKTDLRPNVPTIRLRDTPAPPPRPKYEDAANQHPGRTVAQPPPVLHAGYGLVAGAGTRSQDQGEPMKLAEMQHKCPFCDEMLTFNVTMTTQGADEEGNALLTMNAHITPESTAHVWTHKPEADA